MSSDDNLFLESQIKSKVNNDDTSSEDTLKDYSSSESSINSANEDLDSSDSNISIPRKISRKNILPKYIPDKATQTKPTVGIIESTLDNIIYGIYRFVNGIISLGNDYEEVEQYARSSKRKINKICNKKCHLEEPLLTDESSTDDDNPIVEYVNQIQDPNSSINKEIEAMNIEAMPGCSNCIQENIDLMINNITKKQSDCSSSNED